MRVPAIIAASVICFALGVGAGILTMQILATYGITLGEQKTEVVQGSSQGTPLGPPGGGAPGGAPMMGPPMGPGGGPGGGPPGGGPGGGRGPSAKTQLASLIAKLDQLSQKPLAVNLTDEQRKKVSEQLAGLGDKDELSEDDAKKRLDALEDIVTKDQKEALDAYRLPGQQGGGRPGAAADAPKNPFKEEANGKHLKSLQEQVETKKG
jgi:hypothetical protein